MTCHRFTGSTRSSGRFCVVTITLNLNQTKVTRSNRFRGNTNSRSQLLCNCRGCLGCICISNANMITITICWFNISKVKTNHITLCNCFRSKHSNKFFSLPTKVWLIKQPTAIYTGSNPIYSTWKTHFKLLYIQLKGFTVNQNCT